MKRVRALTLCCVLFVCSSAIAQRAPIPQQLSFMPYHANGIYKIGETVGWTVTPGPEAPTFAYKWTIRRNNAVVLKEGKLDLSSGKDKIEIVGDQPEMIYVAIEPYAALTTASTAPTAPATSAGQSGSATPNQSSPAPDAASTAAAQSGAGAVNQGGSPPSPHWIGGNTGHNNGLYAVGAAVAPMEIPLSTPRPADFDAFWDGKLALQAKVPIDAVLTPVQTNVPGVEMSMFALDALGSKAHGYVARPAADGKYPALIMLQYAGVYALNAHADAERAADGWLVLNVDSHDKLPSDPSGNIPTNYNAIGNTDREKSYFLDMYLRDSRVLDYLATRPDWNGKTVVLTGGSMGGQQSIALAGLRSDEVTDVLVCVPAGADTNGDLHGRKAGYPYWPSENPDAMNAALYFDTVNFASRIKAPVMAGFGFIDTVSPPAGVWTMLNQIPGPKEPVPVIDSEHDNFTYMKMEPCHARTKDILDLLVKAGVYTPKELQP
ncbi:MAG: acetylxylan esterase [Terracidiphilus sp.]|jgi:cephalosporin-C deacetylase-like acetyl esterase